MSAQAAGTVRRAVGPAALALLASSAVAGAYRTGPPPGHTGAFGQPDCAECHFDAVRDDPAGSVTLEAPERFRPGGTYHVTVTLRYPGLPAGGFQLAARVLEGPCAGRQAGRLQATDRRTRIQAGEDGIAYASHSEDGANPRRPDIAAWTLRWTAPASGGAVAFDAAVQAANDDDSEFGERLYRARSIARPEGGGGPDHAHSCAPAPSAAVALPEWGHSHTIPVGSVPRDPGGTPGDAFHR